MNTFALGAYTSVPIGTAAPSGSVGLVMSTVGGRGLQHWSTKVKLVKTGNVDLNITVWRRDVAGDWAPLGANSGDINGGSSFASSGAGTVFFEPAGPADFLGLFEEIYYQLSNNTNLNLGANQTQVLIAPIAGVA